MDIVIDKNKAIKKWAPICESLGVNNDPYKTEMMSIFAEWYSFNDSQTQPFAPHHFIPSSIPVSPTGHLGNFNLLPINMSILSQLNISDRAVYFYGLNNSRLVLVDGVPKNKITLSITKEYDDIKLERRAKLEKMTPSNFANFIVTGTSPIDRIEKMLQGMIVSDINSKLKTGAVLYIDKCIIQSIGLTPHGFETITRYDVI